MRRGVCLVICCLLSAARVCCIPQEHRRQQEEEIQQLRRTAVRQPDDYRAQLQLALALHAMDHKAPDGGQRVPEAEQAYRAALALVPQAQTAGAVWGNLGALLMSAGRLPEAVQALDKAVQATEQAPSSELYAGTLFNKGKALGMMGKGQEAENAFLAAIEGSRGRSLGTYAKSFCSLRKFSDPQTEELRNAVHAFHLLRGEAAVLDELPARRKQPRSQLEAWRWVADADPLDGSWLHFALWTSLQQQGDEAAAWQHLAVANQLQKAAQGHDTEAELKMAATLMAAFPDPRQSEGLYPALMQGQAGHHTKLPIFVVGMPRSGSTLVEQMLASHSSVHGAGEDTSLAPLLPDLMAALHSQAGLDVAAIARVGRTYEARMRAAAGRHTPAAAPPSWPTRVVDKMLRNSWNLGYAAIMLPQAKVVHVVRHPLDVALSCFAQPFEGRGTPWAWTLDDIAAEINVTENVMQHWSAILPPGKILRMPYEELVTQPETAAARLLKHAGLPWEPAVLNFHVNQRAVQTASLSQVRQKLYTSSIGKWKKFRKQLLPVAKALSPLIRQYETELDELAERRHEEL